MYIETTHKVYHSNVLGDIIESRHPIAWKLPSGEVIKCDSETRTIIRECRWVDGLDTEGYMPIYVQPTPFCKSKFSKIKFKILSEWYNDASTSGSKIRWSVPKGSKAVYE